jgi:hypothetical protein
MLDLPRYLLGVTEILLLAGFATLGATTLRRQLLPHFSGPPAWLTTGVIALAILIWAAELLGSFNFFEPLPYLATLAILGLGLRRALEGGWGCPSRAAASRFSPQPGPRTAADFPGEKPSKREGHPHPPPPVQASPSQGGRVVVSISLAIAAVALIHFGADVKAKLSTGMTGFDSTWYHAPFAAGFLQSGDTWGLHFIAPQFLAWFYPANGEIFHAVGMLAFDRDLLSPLLNLGWFLGCLLALWCVGRPYGVAPWSLALGAIALSVPALSDQAGEARNDIVGIFFLLAAVAIALNAMVGVRHESSEGESGGEEVAASGPSGPDPVVPTRQAGAWIVSGLAVGLAAGTKLDFLLPAAVLIVGLAVIAPRGARWRALGISVLASLAGGGYWYLRNLVHTGNPLPWFDHVGPISLPAPEQPLGGREGHSVIAYLTDGGVWSDWFLPGLHHGLTIFWPLLAALALTGLLLPPLRCSFARNSHGKEQRRLGGGDAALCVAGFVGLAAGLAWLIAPTSASGPDGMPRGFESGLRYLTPALVLGLALMPVALKLLSIGLPGTLRGADLGLPPNGRILKTPASLGRRLSGRGKPEVRTGLIVLALVAAITIGYPIQRHYLQNRYANPTFAAPGLNAAFKWASSVSDARVATTSTRQYPLYGADLSNHVQYVGVKTPHGGFIPPSTCPEWRRLLNAGHYDYVVASRDRIEPGKPPYPPISRWTRGPAATVVLNKPPTVVYKLNGPLDPSACP